MSDDVHYEEPLVPPLAKCGHNCVAVFDILGVDIRVSGLEGFMDAINFVEHPMIDGMIEVVMHLDVKDPLTPCHHLDHDLVFHWN